MLEENRSEFDAQVRTLFAGLGISTHDNAERLAERVDAWWLGLGKMPFSQFVRCAEHLLSVTPWPDYLPKRRTELIPADMWKVSREIRGGATGPTDGFGNHIRDYWRSCVVHEVSHHLGHSVTTFEPVLVANRDTLGRSLLALLDELESQERRDGRTVGQLRYCQHKAEQIARMFAQLATEHAPLLAPPSRRDEELFA